MNLGRMKERIKALTAHHSKYRGQLGSLSRVAIDKLAFVVILIVGSIILGAFYTLLKNSNSLTPAVNSILNYGQSASNILLVGASVIVIIIIIWIIIRKFFGSFGGREEV